MMIYIALGLVAWFVFACAWGHMLVLRTRHNHNRIPTSHEREIMTRACRGWLTTGWVDEQAIDDLEALRNCELGFWRKLARQGIVLIVLLVSAPALAQTPVLTDNLLPTGLGAGPTWNDYWRLCAGDRQADALCRRLASELAMQDWAIQSAKAAEEDEHKMRARGCVQLTDQVYATMPPQYDWLCPQEAK